MFECCRKCSKLACLDRNQIENCKNCISYTLLFLQEIDKKLKEDYCDRI